MASILAIRPDMYMGGPVTFERAAAFIEGQRLGAGGRARTPSPISKFHESLHPLTNCEAKPDDQEYEALSALNSAHSPWTDLSRR